MTYQNLENYIPLSDSVPIRSKDNPINPYSEIGQDAFVYQTLNGKTNGTFLEIGGHDYIISSNSYRLEKECNWSGIGIELDKGFEDGWLRNRPNSRFVHGNALTINYGELLKTYNMPYTIDYLSVDIDPSDATLRALIQLLDTSVGYKFNVITFETDYYSNQTTREPSRKILMDAGYILVKSGVCSWLGEQDDFYVHENFRSTINKGEL